MKQLSVACEQALTQLATVVAAVSQEDYRRQSPALGGSTIGQHVRHTLEFFICLKDGVDTGIVNYDRRAHDKSLEEDRSLAIETILQIHDFVRTQTANKPLLLEAGYFPDVEDSCRISTTLYRELAYNIEHAVHHMAIIRIGVRDVAPPSSG